MSALPEQEHHISLDEYIELEESSGIKHEYFQGEAFAMTGASENHNLLVMDVGRHIGNQLAGKSCRPYPSDFRLKIEAMNLYTYPDLSVICGETQKAVKPRETFLNPTVLIEVLSESTEAYDRGKKSEFYRSIPSLQEYLLIAQDRVHVEQYRRQGAAWLFTEYSALEDAVVLTSIGCTLSLAAIYERVQFDAE